MAGLADPKLTIKSSMLAYQHGLDDPLSYRYKNPILECMIININWWIVKLPTNEKIPDTLKSQLLHDTYFDLHSLSYLSIYY